ncbi:MAG TPA: hypothetical protein VFA32_09550, partial [Dehalococcoidia bacterium]|nr:hypothetical protein [Dehalococcoidia bacterium]
SYAKRVEALERLAAMYAAMSPPDVDVRAELIKRVNQMAERIEYWGGTPPVYEGDSQQGVEHFREWVRNRYV